eukprot:282476-Amphidinium_carterae.1
MGIKSIDIPTTVQVIRARSHTLRSELCCLVCDGLWTNSRLFHAQKVDCAACAHCDCLYENTAHVLWDCPHYSEYRQRWPQECFDEFLSLPPCARVCGIAVTGMSESLRVLWPQFQLQMALILGQRRSQNRDPAQSQSHEHRCSDVPKSCSSIDPDLVLDSDMVRRVWDGAEPLDFTLIPPITEWQYSPSQFHQLSRFLASLRKASPATCKELGLRRMTVIELHALYLLRNGGVRFKSNLPSEKRGHWLSFQVQSFLYALRQFQGITDTALVARGQKSSTFANWCSKLGLPPQPELS